MQLVNKQTKGDLKMKFKAFQTNDGSWVVKTHTKNGEAMGRVFASDIEAKQFALHQSMLFYHDMLNKAWKELQEVSETCDYGDSVYLVSEDVWVNKRDLLA